MRALFLLALVGCGTPAAPADAGTDATDAASSTWTLVASGLPQQAVQALAVAPNDPMTVYAGLTASYSAGSGVYVTTNGGASWTASNAGIATAPVFSIAIDPSDAAKMYAGLFGELVSSADHGATWTPYDGAGTIVATNGPVIAAYAPTDATRACVGGHRGLWCTTTHGASWDALITAPTQPNVLSIVFDPADATSFWENTEHWKDEALTTDKAPGVAIAYDGTTLYSGLYPQDGAMGVRVSTNGGSSWTDASDALPSVPLVRQIAVARGVAYAAAGAQDTTSGNAFMLASSSLYTRAGAGGTWTLDANVPNANAIAVAPSDDRVVYVGTLDGRVYRRNP